ncbi:MAG: hypothetical protein HY226_01420 [Candidatus Vogelbacteria bacterium]|nr:hypothetical protein [Candidatus Vogelbacteria bacterium]
MSEGSDYDPGPWRGNDFSSARKSYEKRIGRSYADAITKNKTQKDLLESCVSTQCSSPLIIAADHTGSMGKWIAQIFGKLGYLANEVKTYLGDDMQISFCAVGDAFSDSYPLQVRPFTGGLDLQSRLNELVIERGGGNNKGESYELAALYYANKFSSPMALRKPVIVFICDDVPHDLVDRSQAKNIAGVNLSYNMSARDVFSELKSKFSVYVILKPPKAKASMEDARNRKVYSRWVELLDEKHIKVLPVAERVADVIFGILAEDTDKNDEFIEDMEIRQTPEQRRVVYEALGRNVDGTLKGVKSVGGMKSLADKIVKMESLASNGKSVLRPLPKKIKPGRLY